MSSIDDTQARPTTAETGGSGETDEQSISDLADQVSGDTDDPAVQQLAEAAKQLAIDQRKLDDLVRVMVADRLDEAEGRLDDLEVDMVGLQETQSEHDQRLKSFIGPAPDATPRDKRLKDIRTGMIEAAQNNERSGTRWHRYDIEDFLGSHSYSPDEIPAKPQLRKDIKDIAEEDGFTETSKPHEGKDGISRDVLAVKMILNELPPHLARNQVTTEGARGGTRSGGGTAADKSNNG